MCLCGVMDEQVSRQEWSLMSTESWSLKPHHNLFPGPPGWAGARRELLDFMVQGKINTGRHTDHPAGHHSVRTNQCPPPPSPHFFAGRMPFLPPNQQCQSTEDMIPETIAKNHQSHSVIICICVAFTSQRRCMIVLRESLLRGLELMCICLAFFPPSSQFLPYLQLHLTCPLDSGIMRFTQVTHATHLSLVIHAVSK